MSVEYDLVIIGSTIAGIDAALQAARCKARVALIQQNCHPRFPWYQAFAQIGRTLQRVDRVNQLQLFDAPLKTSALDLAQVNRWVSAIAQSQQEFYSPEKLAASGIEVISGSGEFRRKPQAGFLVNGRLFRARAYLIAADYTLTIPEIPGLETVHYLTPDTIPNAIPRSLIIVGDDPVAVELAQLYARLGSQVTMVIRQPHLLAIADSEVAFYVQAQLEAEGIRVISAIHISEVIQTQKKKRIHAGTLSIEADEILFATGWQPQTEGLNLDAVNIREPIKLNEKLQTRNSHVYWCGHPVNAIAQSQAYLAVNNALFAPIRKFNHHDVIQSIETMPELAWIGLTEVQAVRKYRKDVLVLRQSFSSLLKLQVTGDITGLCKIIVHRDGRIIGAHIVGQNASELISTIAVAIRRNTRIQDFNQMPALSDNLTALFRNAAQDWYAWNLNRKSVLQDLQESYFAWQRSLPFDLTKIRRKK